MMVSSEIVLVKEFYCSPNPVLKCDKTPQLPKSEEPVKRDGSAEDSSVNKGRWMPDFIDICSSTESEKKVKKPPPDRSEPNNNAHPPL